MFAFSIHQIVGFCQQVQIFRAVSFYGILYRFFHAITRSVRRADPPPSSLGKIPLDVAVSRCISADRSAWILRVSHLFAVC